MTADPGPKAPTTIEVELLQQLGWVRRLAASLVHDGDAAADIAQEVAGEWIARRPTWAEHGSGLRRWLDRVTRSRSIDHLRAERARRRRELAAAKPPADDDVHGVLDRLERQQRVAQAVRDLPEPYRSTLLQRYLDELPTHSVALRTGVSEATVRKRIERGLAMLETRLDGEFGTSSRVWALALLGPAWRSSTSAVPVAIGPGAGLPGTMVMGAGVMMSKKLCVAIGSLVLFALAALWLVNATGDPPPVEAGGRGVVVSEAEALAREPAASSERIEVAPPEGAGPAASAVAQPVIRGFVFVDEQHVAPTDLAIAVERPGHAGTADPQVQIDVAAGTWSLRPQRDESVTLWVTSATTVPAQIPVPTQLLQHGGVFDLHLFGGRSLHLSFLDEATRAPLANLEFDLGKAIELQRGSGRVLTRQSLERHRSDAEGRAIVRGVPEAGAIHVTTDVGTRVRSILMRDGNVMRCAFSGEPIWWLTLDANMPRRIEQTILTKAPLGEAWAKGLVPAWARATDRTKVSGVRVVARRWSDQPRERGDAFVLDQDADGGFVLREQAPQQFRVWLEAGRDREPVSAPTLVTLDHPGEHAPIVLQPLDVFDVHVHCVHVPASGRLELQVGSPGSQVRSQQFVCAGQPLTLTASAAAGEALRLSLRAGADETGKTAWQRQIVVDPGQPEVHVDLAGGFVDVRVSSEALDLRGQAAVVLMACRSGSCSTDERIVVLLVDGSSSQPVFVPAGRWLFHYSPVDAGVAWPHAVWGVVDVPAAGADVLSLQPRLCLVPRHEVQPGRRFDEIDGVSLRALPERIRIWQPAAEGEPVAMPIGALHQAIAAPK